MFIAIFNKRWPTVRRIRFYKSKTIGYPPVNEQFDKFLLCDLVKVHVLLSMHFTTPVQDNDSFLYVVERSLSDSKWFQMVSNIYNKVSNHLFYYVIDNKGKPCKVYKPRSTPRQPETMPRKAYKPEDKPRKSRVENKPRKAYKPEDKPRKAYKPRVEDTPRKAYKPRVEDTPRKAYKPRVEDTPRKAYKPRVEDKPRKANKQRKDKGVKRKHQIDDHKNIENINFDAKNYYDKYNSASCFETCCVCGHEDAPINMRDKCSYDMSKLKELFELKLEALHDLNTSCQDKEFIEEVKNNLPEGVLSTTNKVCVTCTKHLNSKIKKSNPKGKLIFYNLHKSITNYFSFVRYPTKCLIEWIISRIGSTRTSLFE